MSTPTNAPRAPKVTSLVEALGVLIVVLGAGFLVAAAALVSTALACLAAGFLLVIGGIVTVYVAAALDRPEPKKPAGAA